MKFPMLAIALLILATMPGCALWRPHKKEPKPAAHVYEGDAPSIHMGVTESAGGVLKTY